MPDPAVLLEKSRIINRILQKANGQYVNFKEISDALKNIIQANVFILNPKGVILEFSIIDEFKCNILVNRILCKGFFPQRYNDDLLRYNDLKENLKQKSGKCIFFEEEDCYFSSKIVTVIPIIGRNLRQGTLLLIRLNKHFGSEDMILAERGATIVGMEILRAEAEKIEKETRHRAIVKLVMKTLSHFEQESVKSMIKELDSSEGFVVSGKIADKLGISRSVVVNALRKLESAGIIKSSSLGMKGTHIKVINPYLFDCLRVL